MSQGQKKQEKLWVIIKKEKFNCLKKINILFKIMIWCYEWSFFRDDKVDSKRLVVGRDHSIMAEIVETDNSNKAHDLWLQNFGNLVLGFPKDGNNAVGEDHKLQSL